MALSVLVIVGANHFVGACLVDESVHHGEGILRKQVIGIGKHDESALSMLQSVATRCRHPSVLLVESLQSRFQFSPFVADIARAVCAAILHDNHLETVERLRKNAHKTFIQVFGLVIDGYDDRYLHLSIFLLFYFSQIVCIRAE